MKPAIGGIRVSTDMQADRYGPARQREDILREADEGGSAAGGSGASPDGQ